MKTARELLEDQTVCSIAFLAALKAINLPFKRKSDHCQSELAERQSAAAKYLNQLQAATKKAKEFLESDNNVEDEPCYPFSVIISVLAYYDVDVDWIGTEELAAELARHQKEKQKTKESNGQRPKKNT